MPERLDLIDPEQIRAYLRMLYLDFEADIGAVTLRGVGEKGTAQEGVFHQNVSFPLGASLEELLARVLDAARRWGQHFVGTFMLPGSWPPRSWPITRGPKIA